MKKLLLALVIMASGWALANDSKKASHENKASEAKEEQSNIAQIGHDAFMKAPGLTEAQKIKLSDVMKTTFSDAQKIKIEIANQKIDLFDAITNPTAKDTDVQNIKKKIADLDQKRLALMFKSLDEVQKIIGKNPETGKYLRNIMRERMRIYDRD